MKDFSKWEWHERSRRWVASSHGRAVAVEGLMPPNMSVHEFIAQRPDLRKDSREDEQVLSNQNQNQNIGDRTP